MRSILFLFFSAILFSACKKQLDPFNPPALAKYYPLTVGKYITYNLDSTVFTNFGQNMVVVHYQAQDRVDDSFQDNNGTKQFRVVRYLRQNSNQEWVPNNTFLVKATDNTIEVVVDNLRYQKLKNPINNGFSWKGNSYIDSYSLNSDVKYLDDWDYTYDSVNVPLKFGSLTIDSTIKVAQRDEFLGQDPKLPGTQYAEKNYSIEKYGANIGLIYKEFLHWEYQGSQPGRSGYFVGYGIKLTIVDHN